MLEKIKKMIIDKEGLNIKININNIRNKSEVIIGKVTEIYDRVFILDCSDGIKRSFNYSDILTGTIEII